MLYAYNNTIHGSRHVHVYMRGHKEKKKKRLKKDTQHNAEVFNSVVCTPYIPPHIVYVCVCLSVSVYNINVFFSSFSFFLFLNFTKEKTEASRHIFSRARFFVM